jgi:hypothetical protein
VYDGDQSRLFKTVSTTEDTSNNYWSENDERGDLSDGSRSGSDFSANKDKVSIASSSESECSGSDNDVADTRRNSSRRHGATSPVPKTIAKKSSRELNVYRSSR